MPRKRGIREKRIHCGVNYLEVDITPEPTGVGRGKKENPSTLKQRNLNDKNARRYFRQLAHSNFTPEDLRVDLTYKAEFLPKTAQEAERMVRNYIRRVNYHRKKAGLPPAKVLIVTEVKTTRIHHHLIISGGLDRNLMEKLWRAPRRKGEEEGRRLGYANALQLQFDEMGIAALTAYLMKGQSGKKRWSGTHNLEKPVVKRNDSRYGRRQVEQLARNPEDPAFWERQYEGYQFIQCKPVHNDLTGWSLYLRMKRRN